jgi:hypothetical protein
VVGEANHDLAQVSRPFLFEMLAELSGHPYVRRIRPAIELRLSPS